MPLIVFGRGRTDAAGRRGLRGTRQLLAGYGYFFLGNFNKGLPLYSGERITSVTV